LVGRFKGIITYNELAGVLSFAISNAEGEQDRIDKAKQSEYSAQNDEALRDGIA
jgi:hypothetical protein